MASTKVRGITIELGADTSGISQALKGVNSDLNKTQKDLRDVERLLKLDPTNTELLAQKQKLLADRVSETREKIDQLKQAQASIDLSTEEGQRQYDALTREIVSCENALKQAEQEATGFNATAAKISATAGKLSDKFGSLADKTRGLSMAAGGALVGLAGIAVKAGKDADDLNTLAKQTGVATDELQKMQYASDLIDVDVSSITGSLKKMKKGLDSNSEAFEELGVQTKKNGQFRDVTDIFYDTVAALSQIPNETERDVKAMEIFGKSADELAGIIDDGGLSLKQLGEEAENMGVIISQEDLDKANELNDTLDSLKAEIMPTLMQMGIEIAQAIMPYIPQIKEAISQVLEILRNVSPQMVIIVGAVLGLVAALSPLFSALSGITGVISAVTGGAGALGGALSALAGPIGIIIAIIAVLIAAFVHLWNTNDEFRNNIIATWERIKASFDAFGQGIIQRLNEMGFEFSSFSDVVKAIWEQLCNFFAPIFEDVFAGLATMLDGALKILTGIFDVFAGLFTGNWEQMWKGIKEIVEGYLTMLKGYIGTFVNYIIDEINFLIDGINSLGAIKGIGISIPTIPKIAMANGGVLSKGTALVGEAGPELLTMANGRAVVQPLTNNNTTNYAGNTNNFYIQSNDPYQVAEQVSHILDQDYARQRSVFA
jgi:phage-related minor tail protein